MNIVVVFPKKEIARSIRNLLVRCGFDVAMSCTTGAQAISIVESWEGGIVVSGYQFADMMYNELQDYLPPQVEMLLITSTSRKAEIEGEDIVCLDMPIKAQEIMRTIEIMLERQRRKRKEEKSKPKVRTEGDQILIENAKLMLMKMRDCTEEEAHRYLQKRSMDAGKSLIITAQLVIEQLNAE